jgi:hypothetical protein
MKHGSGGGKPRGNSQNQVDRPEHSEYRDTHGGTYDVDPAFASDRGQGEFGGQPPEGQTRERKGPLNPSSGRR